MDTNINIIIAISGVLTAVLLLWLTNQTPYTVFVCAAVILSPILGFTLSEFDLIVWTDWFMAIWTGAWIAAFLVLYSVDWKHWALHYKE